MSIMATSNLLALGILLCSSVFCAYPDSFPNERPSSPLSVFVRSSRELPHKHAKKASPLPAGPPAGAVAPKRLLPAPKRPFGNHPHSKGQKWPFRFQYVVDDEATNNFQTRHEEGDAQGTVRGCYQVLEPTGLVRTVSYKADSRGFKVLSITNDPDKIPCTAPESKETSSPFEEAFNRNLDGPPLLLNHPFYSSKFREASRNQYKQNLRFSSQNFGALEQTTSPQQDGYISHLTSSSGGQKSDGKQFAFRKTHQFGGKSVTENKFSQNFAHASAFNVNSKFKNKSSNRQSKDYEKKVDENFRNHQSIVRGKNVHNIDQIQSLAKYKQISNQDSTESYDLLNKNTDDKEAYKTTEIHTKDEWMAEYLQNLSKSIFSTFKNITSLSIANGDYSKHINFPFVLIPITSFLRLRNKGLVDKDVQGFGTVIQQKNIGAETRPPKRVQKIISNIYNKEIKTTNQIKSKSKASRTSHTEKVERVKHSRSPSTRVQRDFKPSASPRNNINDTPSFNYLNGRNYSDINKKLTPRKFLYVKDVKDYRPDNILFQPNPFSKFQNENSRALLRQIPSPAMHLSEWSRNIPSRPLLGSNYEINANPLPKPWHLPNPHAVTKFVSKEVISGKGKGHASELSREKTSSIFTSPPIQDGEEMTIQPIPNIKDRTTIT